MKFEENWPRGYRGEVVQKCDRMEQIFKKVRLVLFSESPRYCCETSISQIQQEK